MPLTHIDCFAGPGGICTGLHAAGFSTLVAIEYIQSCCDTYSANHPEVHMIHSDIRKVKKEDIEPYLPVGGVDLVTSGMPCETFSTAGNTSRSFYDDRQFLFREGIRIAKLANAKMILFENVPGITSKTVSKDSTELIVDVLKSELRKAGYGNFKEIILSANQFGVPQKRNRFFILATRFKKWNLSVPIADENAAVVTVDEALAGLPNVKPNSGKEAKKYLSKSSAYSDLMQNDEFWKREGFPKGLTYQMPMKHRPCTLERFALLRPGESLKSLFDRFTGEEREALQNQRILPKKLFIKRNYRLLLSEPSPTVTSHCLDEFVHPTHNRALTVRECARLQSFPDSYDFCGGPYIVPHIDRSVQDKYEQIGDAVPPLLAYAWGKEIISIFEKNNMNDCFEFCLNQYNQYFDLSYSEQVQALGDRTLSDKKRDEFEKEAQKQAIKNAIIEGIKQFPGISVAEIWAAIFQVHMYRKSGISNKEVIDHVISADQSWKKSSGHAFEEMVKAIANLNLVGTDIEVILQRDLNILIKDQELKNEPRDISWLKEQIAGNIFDLYAITKKNGKTCCFGCIQAKTSIRDRVTRDREPSIQAMESFFWSSIFVLDGAFLKLPKFQHMVNGGSTEFSKNGWHGMYSFTDDFIGDRIYKTDLDMNNFKEHIITAANFWLSQRQWMNQEWRAE